MQDAQLRKPPVPYWRLSSFYFFYFAILGVLAPYWPLYFQWLGFGPEQIGWLLGTVTACKVVAPNLWAWLADRSGKRLLVMRLGCLLASLFFAGHFLELGFFPLMAILFAYSFFWNAILPQQEAITLSFLGGQPERYSLIRLWGSVGFIVLVLLAGALLGDENIVYLPAITMALLLLTMASSLVIPSSEKPRTKTVSKGFWPLVLKKSPVAFLLGGLLMQLGHGAYYGFFSIHLQGLNYSEFTIGWLWALGVIAEVLLFLLMHRLLPRFGVKGLLLVSLLLAAIRWLLIGHLADQMAWLLLSQVLHAFTFGVFHAAAVEGVRRLFGSEHQSKAQALYTAVSFGMGGAVGSIVAGQVWHLGAEFTFNLAALVSLLGLVVIACWYRETRG
ncbi:MFS transporter [Porticoccus sp. W117]|uniref:MFS transporter n=1 Tax=Porticoccus sp. W117 TaxID=3054777 RepID=UPI00259798A2|nr:MFS transporter [Porticoccus sp. W117]MDM3872284.1 MFS transporter [Porticoccus sp. W117]